MIVGCQGQTFESEAGEIEHRADCVAIDGARQIVADKSIAGHVEGREKRYQAGRVLADFYPWKMRKNEESKVLKPIRVNLHSGSSPNVGANEGACQKYASRFEHRVNLVDGGLRVGNVFETWVARTKSNDAVTKGRAASSATMLVNPVSSGLPVFGRAPFWYPYLCLCA